MSVILNIETSSKNCSVCLSSKGNLVRSFDLEDEAYRHSELLTSSIQNILNENNLDVSGLSAVSENIRAKFDYIFRLKVLELAFLSLKDYVIHIILI